MLLFTMYFLSFLLFSCTLLIKFSYCVILYLFDNFRQSVSSVAQSCPTLQPHESRAHQASLSITNSWSLLKRISIESVMPSSHLILCHPLLLTSIPPSIRVFSNESTLHMRWPKYWSFSFSISPSNEHPGLISLGWTGWISLQSKDSQESLPTPQFKSINFLALSLLHSPTLTSIHDHWP